MSNSSRRGYGRHSPEQLTTDQERRRARQQRGRQQSGQGGGKQSGKPLSKRERERREAAALKGKLKVAAQQAPEGPKLARPKLSSPFDGLAEADVFWGDPQLLIGGSAPRGDRDQVPASRWEARTMPSSARTRSRLIS